MVLSDADIARQRAPITTPLPPPGPISPPPLPVWADKPELTPPSRPAPATPPLPGLAAAPAPSAQDLLIDKSNSQILGDNMRAAGRYPPGLNYEAHHMVPSRAGDARMDAVRAKLAGLGLDSNNAANGVWLPGSKADPNAPEAYHPRMKNDVYNEAVAAAFDDVTTIQSAIATLGDIRLQLQNNDFPGVRPRPDKGIPK